MAFNRTLAPDITEPSATDGVSIFTALREQAGLRLEPGRAMLNVVVVERAEQPTEN